MADWPLPCCTSWIGQSFPPVPQRTVNQINLPCRPAYHGFAGLVVPPGFGHVWTAVNQPRFSRWRRGETASSDRCGGSHLAHHGELGDKRREAEVAKPRPVGDLLREGRR